jgi:hypothetical protein
MTVRRGLGLILLLVAAYVLWDATRAVFMLVERGSSLSDALLQPPLSAIKIFGGALALLGGGLASTNKPLGAVTGLLGALIYAAAPALIAWLSPSPAAGLRDGIPALIMIGAAIALMTQRRVA